MPDTAHEQAQFDQDLLGSTSLDLRVLAAVSLTRAALAPMGQLEYLSAYQGAYPSDAGLDARDRVESRVTSVGTPSVKFTNGSGTAMALNSLLGLSAHSYRMYAALQDPNAETSRLAMSAMNLSMATYGAYDKFSKHVRSVVDGVPVAASFSAKADLMTGALGMAMLIYQMSSAETDEERAVVGAEMGLQVAGTIANVGAMWVMASRVARGVAVARAMTAAPLAGMVMGTLMLAISPMQIYGLMKQEEYADVVEELGQRMLDVGYGGDLLLGNFLQEQASLSQEYFYAQNALMAAALVVEVLLAATVIGAPLALGMAVVIGIVQAVLPAIQQAQIESLAQEYAQKIDAAGGSLAYFDRNMAAQYDMLIQSSSMTEYLAELQRSMNVDSVVAVTTTQLSWTAMDLAALTRMTDDIHTSMTNIDRFASGQVSGHGSLFLDPVTGLIDIGGGPGATQLFAVTNVLLQPGQERRRRVKTGKNAYTTTLTIADSEEGWTIRDGDASTTLDVRNVVTQAYSKHLDEWAQYQVDHGRNLSEREIVDHTVEVLDGDVPLTIRTGGGDDTLIANTANIHFYGGQGSDTISYTAIGTPGTRGITMSPESGGWLVVHKESDEDVWVETTSESEHSAGKRSETLEYRDFELQRVSLNASDVLLGVENIIGSKGDDLLWGGAADNYLSGYRGIDTLMGAGGDDILSPGSDVSGLLDGGDGTDMADFAEAGSGVLVDLSHRRQEGAITGFLAYGLSTEGLWIGTPANGYALARLENIENLTGSRYGDILIGNAGANVLIGGEGADYVSGHEGSDALVGGAGRDTLNGGEGVDTAVYSGLSTGIWADLGVGVVFKGVAPMPVWAISPTGNVDDISNVEQVIGTSFADSITGSAGNDVLWGGDGDDYLMGGAGDDRLDGGAGLLYLNGQDGVDTADLASAGQALQADLRSHEILRRRDGSRLGNVFEIENLIGTSGDDLLDGDNGANQLDGGRGDDVLRGWGGADQISIDGRDTVDGGDGDDFIVARTLVFNSLLPDAAIVGGAGNDTLDLSGVAAAPGRWVVGLGTGVASGGEWAATLTGVENLVGADADSELSGNAGANIIVSGDGNDMVVGHGGHDELYGGRGDDRLYGDSGWSAGTTDIGVSGNDLLAGGAGRDVVYAEQGDDTVLGAVDGDTLQGGEGTDLLSYDTVDNGAGVDASLTTGRAVGGYGQDLISGFENLQGTASADLLEGSAEGNLLDGGDGDDVIRGLAGDDQLAGGAGNDSLDAGVGDDVFAQALDASNDTLAGGDGLDAVDYSVALRGVATGEGVYADLADGMAWKIGRQSSTGLDRLSGIESVIGTQLADTLLGNASANALDGAEGNDRLDGRGGHDLLLGITGSDTLDGGAGNDTLVGGAGDDAVVGGDGMDTFIQDLSGSDTLVGGADVDVVDYGAVALETAALGIVADLRAGRVSKYAGPATGTPVQDTVIGIEGVSGTKTADRLLGDAGANALWGMGGADSIEGREGSDLLDGGRGNDSLLGGAGDDMIMEGLRLAGGAVPEFDLIDGGLDIDTLSYANDDGELDGVPAWTTGVMVDLALGQARTPDGADVIRSIENVTGSALSDRITGDGSANVLSGGAGNDALDGGGADDLLNGGTGFDWIIGGVGDDTLAGGADADTLVGGAGSDTYRYGIGDGRDRIVEQDVAGSTASDVLILGSGTGVSALSADKLWFSRSGNDLVVRCVGDADSMLTVEGWYIDDAHKLERIVSADGKSIDRDQITMLAGLMTPSPIAWTQVQTGADLSGAIGANTLAGGRGDDRFEGGTGSDTYLFGRGAGSDLIVEADTAVSGARDVLKLVASNGMELLPTDVWLARVGNDLQVSLIGSSRDRVTVSGWFTSAAGQLESFEASNGLKLAREDVSALLLAMTAPAPERSQDMSAAARTAIGRYWKRMDGSVIISGPARQYQVLTASNSLTDTDGMGAVSYRWQRSGTSGQEPWADIAGATSADFTVTAAQSGWGYRLRAVATYTDSYGAKKEVYSAPTDEVQWVSTAPTGALTISGTPKQNQALSVTSTLADVDNMHPLNHQWQVSSDDGASWSNVSGATGTSFTPTQAHTGQRFRVVASYIDWWANAESVASAATAVVANVDDAPTGSVTISGTARQKDTLVASHSLADADGLGSVAWQWQFLSAFSNLPWTDIAGATGSSLTLGRREAYGAVRVVATYTDGAGKQESVTSAATAQVLATDLAPAAGPVVSIGGIARQLQTLTTGIDNSGGMVVVYRWQSSADGQAWTDIPGALNSSFTLGQDLVNRQVRSGVGLRDVFGNTTFFFSDATAKTADVNDAPTGGVTITGSAAQRSTLTASSTLADADGLGALSYQWQASADNGITWAGVGTGASFTLSQAEVGKQMRVVAGYKDTRGVNESVASAVTAAVSNVNDVPTGSVYITGTASANKVLRATNTLVDADGLGAVSYEWQQVINNTWTPIATGQSIVLTAAQASSVIRIAAKYIDGGGRQETVMGESVASGTWARLGSAAPTGAVSFTGSARQGAQLTASHSLSDADGLGAITYAWQQSSDGTTWSNIATGVNFTLTQAQVGKRVHVVASYTDAKATPEAVASSATALVLDEDDATTGSVTITGQAAQHQTLTASHTLADADGIRGAVSYRWQVSGPNGQGPWTSIDNATGADFTLTAAESGFGRQIRVLATCTDGRGSPFTVASAPTLAVEPGNAAPGGSVKIVGTAKQYQTLTVANTLSDADGMQPVSYQWQQSPDGATNSWVNIAGATQASFTLGQAQAGMVLRVVATYLDGWSRATSVASAETTVVVNVNDAPTGSVTLAGTARQNAILSANVVLSDADGVAGNQGFKWQQSLDNGATWAAIVGANAGSFKLTQAQVGKLVRVVHGYTDGWGNVTEVASAPTASVANVNDAPSGGLAIRGIAMQNQVLTVDNTLADADGLGTIAYTWQRSFDQGASWAAIGSGASFTLRQSEVGMKVRLQARYTDALGTSEVVTSATTLAVTDVNDAPTGSVSIAGVASQNQVLTATQALADADGLGSVAFAWQQSSDNGLSWTSIAGANGSAYALKQSQVGKRVRVVASATDAFGRLESVASTPTVAVGHAGGSDTYRLSDGGGQIVLQEEGGNDTIVFGTNTNADQLWFSRWGNDLVISTIGTADQVTVDDWYVDANRRVETFRSGNGQQLLGTQIDNLVAAMAGLAPPAAGQTRLPAAYQAQLLPVISANWVAGA